MLSMGKREKPQPASWAEPGELGTECRWGKKENPYPYLGENRANPLPPISVIIYRYFSYRQWALCVKFLCACAKEPRYFPDRGIDRSTDCELTRAARPTPGKIARGATQLRGFDPRAPRPDPAGDGEQAAALRNMSLCYSALFPCRPASLDLFLSSSTERRNLFAILGIQRARHANTPVFI